MRCPSNPQTPALIHLQLPKCMLDGHQLFFLCQLNSWRHFWSQTEHSDQISRVLKSTQFQNPLSLKLSTHSMPHLLFFVVSWASLFMPGFLCLCVSSPRGGSSYLSLEPLTAPCINLSYTRSSQPSLWMDFHHTREKDCPVNDIFINPLRLKQT